MVADRARERTDVPCDRDVGVGPHNRADHRHARGVRRDVLPDPDQSLGLPGVAVVEGTLNPRMEETMDGKLKVMFLCTGNSCRSQMAEGWARHLKADRI